MLGTTVPVRLVVVVGGAVIGFFGPGLYLYQKTYDRTARLERDLPDAIDLLTISVESGLGFDAAIQQVARNTEGPLADEFSRVLREMQIGQARSAALRAFADRTNVANVRTFVSAMVQADAFGIPVAQVLRIQSSEMRVKRRQRAEEKAQQVPVKITIPLIFCILPCLFMAVMGPAVINIMDSFQEMSTHAHRPPSARLAVGARVFGLVVLSAPTLWSRDDTGVLALVAVGAIWLASSVAEALRVNPTLVSLIEAGLIGSVAALSIGSSLAVLGALAIPPFTASLRHGPRGMLLALSAELIPLVILSAVLHGGMLVEQGVSTFTWVVTGIGLGLIGSFVRASLYAASDPLTPYRDAQALLRELIDLSGQLGSGLDPVSLGGTIAERVRDQLPVTALAVHVPRGHDLRPLISEPGSSPESLGTLEVLALEACRTVRTARDGNAFAFPLLTDAGLVAVVSASLTDGLHPDAARLEGRLNDLAQQLEPTAVHLDTAILFGYFRDAATTEERRRLAREMHDGVAQEIASIGYLVDGIAAQSTAAAQTAQLRVLRERITGVVAEVRRSVQSLRTEVSCERQPRQCHRRPGQASQRQLGDPDPGQRRRAHHPAPHRRRGRAAADRPGGHDQRGPPLRRLVDRGALPGRRSRRRDRRPSTTVPASDHRRSDSHGLEIMQRARPTRRRRAHDRGRRAARHRRHGAPAGDERQPRGTDLLDDKWVTA